MKKTNALTWILSFVGSLLIISSFILVLPTISKATTITIECPNGNVRTCEGFNCVGMDNDYCECVNYQGEVVSSRSCKEPPPIID